ncbi:hypothetical protein FB451DRAFT_1386198 [Mycena latifolia]|nr:hypothetical protein FB451DRAFT_1386198 [Mycena latifolia]
MFFLFGHAAALFRRGAGVPGRVKALSIPLYHRRPSGLAVFGPALLAFDAVLMASTVPITWTHWKTPPKDGEVRTLRPWWMRAAACSLELATGAVLAGTLLVYRSRMVTLISILPPKNPTAAPTAFNRRIFIQTAHNWGRNGTIFPLSACTMTRVEKQVMFLQVKGEFAGWQLNLDKSTVDGEPATSASVEHACQTFARHWQGAGGKATILTT